MLRSDLCDYSDVNIKGDITVSARDGAHNKDRKNKSLTF